MPKVFLKPRWHRKPCCIICVTWLPRPPGETLEVVALHMYPLKCWITTLILTLWFKMSKFKSSTLLLWNAVNYTNELFQNPGSATPFSGVKIMGMRLQAFLWWSCMNLLIATQVLNDMHYKSHGHMHPICPQWQHKNCITTCICKPNCRK